ncbi:MAG: Transcriptional regulatory protein BtsR [Luteibacter sp.]|uniref:LytTR family DNA-binding domain-containing protein n=1 Tax=Luteibacter sp. TaxID=1886636 RepID=UPI00137E4C94|nr:LytTR family DNA-binding domain-containing protein [Luteibacter sp.]KAF1005619.1 MAG: Transcriptional regulatory protein BtsR [Luteibacter sp.]
MTSIPLPPGHDLARAHRRRRWLLVIFWVVIFGSSALSGTITGRIDADRYHVEAATWQIATAETSSSLVSLLILPFLLIACDRWPLHADTWRRRLPFYVLGSMLWCALHVTGMDLLRMLVFHLKGVPYDPGDLALQAVYEYLKDVRTFFMIVAVEHLVEWFGRRLRGEASLLVAPEEGLPVEPVDRPERFLVRKLGQDFLVATADIEWAQASGNYVNLRVRGRDYPLRSTLAALESRLDPAVFVRVHRSYLVRLAQVTSIEPLDGGDARLHMADGSQLPCSRRYREALRAAAAGPEPVVARA